jgi:hypothetical protein
MTAEFCARYSAEIATDHKSKERVLVGIRIQHILPMIRELEASRLTIRLRRRPAMWIARTDKASNNDRPPRPALRAD